MESPVKLPVFWVQDTGNSIAFHEAGVDVSDGAEPFMMIISEFDFGSESAMVEIAEFVTDAINRMEDVDT